MRYSRPQSWAMRQASVELPWHWKCAAIHLHGFVPKSSWHAPPGHLKYLKMTSLMLAWTQTFQRHETSSRYWGFEVFNRTKAKDWKEHTNNLESTPETQDRTLCHPRKSFEYSTMRYDTCSLPWLMLLNAWLTVTNLTKSQSETHLILDIPPQDGPTVETGLKKALLANTKRKQKCCCIWMIPCKAFATKSFFPITSTLSELAALVKFVQLFPTVFGQCCFATEVPTMRKTHAIEPRARAMSLSTPSPSPPWSLRGGTSASGAAQGSWKTTVLDFSAEAERRVSANVTM